MHTGEVTHKMGRGAHSRLWQLCDHCIRDGVLQIQHRALHTRILEEELDGQRNTYGEKIMLCEQAHGFIPRLYPPPPPRVADL